MSQVKKIRWCFIGTGALAKKIAGQILSTGRHEIASCYTRNYQNAQSFAREFGGTAYETAEEAMLDERVDAVYVVTPHNAHAAFAKQALLLKKPVLCEKPFTVTARETEELIALAKKQGVYLAEAMWTWFAPAANRVKAWIDANAIGEIQRADMSYCGKVTEFNRRTDPRRAGGALLDIAIYPITYAYRLWGRPTAIRAQGTVENGIDTDEQVELDFANGVTAHIISSIRSGEGEKMEIVGSKGNIRVPQAHGSAYAYCTVDGKEQVFKADGPDYGNYLYEFDTVAEEILSGQKESAMVPLKATADVMRILDDIRRQIGLVYDDLES